MFKILFVDDAINDIECEHNEEFYTFESAKKYAINNKNCCVISINDIMVGTALKAGDWITIH